jgi:hypothetical protein
VHLWRLHPQSRFGFRRRSIFHEIAVANHATPGQCGQLVVDGGGGGGDTDTEGSFRGDRVCELQFTHARYKRQQLRERWPVIVCFRVLPFWVLLALSGIAFLGVVGPFGFAFLCVVGPFGFAFLCVVGPFGFAFLHCHVLALSPFAI